MNLVADGRAERAVHQLMALHRALAGKDRGNHHGLEMDIVLALDQRAAAGEARLDKLRYLLWIHTRSCNKSKLTLYHSRMILDFTDVPYIDSAGLGSLVSTFVSRHKAGRRVALVGVNKRVAKVFEVTRVDSLFLQFKTLDEAIEALTSAGHA